MKGRLSGTSQDQGAVGPRSVCNKPSWRLGAPQFEDPDLSKTKDCTAVRTEHCNLTKCFSWLSAVLRGISCFSPPPVSVFGLTSDQMNSTLGSEETSGFIHVWDIFSQNTPWSLGEFTGGKRKSSELSALVGLS